jgi:hypothetical protein
MSLAERIAAASRVEVEAPAGSGLWWRVQRVVSADLARVQVAALRMVTPAVSKATDDSEAEQARAIARVSDKDLANVDELTQGVICAGVTHSREGLEGEWTPIRITRLLEERDISNEVLHITDLPAGCDRVLYEAISSCHADAKGAAERLARFRGAA